MSETTIAALQLRAFKQAVDAGFHDHNTDTEREALAENAMRIALMHSELSEALEELRAGRGPSDTYYPHHVPGCSLADWLTYRATGSAPACTCKPKPAGVPSELADVVIRVLDFCATHDIDLESMIVEKLDYNATQPPMHGGKAF